MFYVMIVGLTSDSRRRNGPDSLIANVDLVIALRVCDVVLKHPLRARNSLVLSRHLIDPRRDAAWASMWIKSADETDEVLDWY